MSKTLQDIPCRVLAGTGFFPERQSGGIASLAGMKGDSGAVMDPALQ